MTTEQLWNEYSDLTTESMQWWQFEKAVDKLQAENERAWNAVKRYMTEVTKCNKGFRRLNRKLSDLQAENEALKKQMESQELYTELGRFTYNNLYREWDPDDETYPRDEIQNTCDFDPKHWDSVNKLFNQIQESEGEII